MAEALGLLPYKLFSIGRGKALSLKFALRRDRRKSV